MSLRWIIVSIFTRSDLNRIRKETLRKTISLIDGWIHARTRSRKHRMRKSYFFTVSSNMANDSFNLCVSIFVSFSVNGLKENAENFNYYPILRKKSRSLFVSVNSPWMRDFFVASSNAVNGGYDQGERCLSAVLFALLT